MAGPSRPHPGRQAAARARGLRPRSRGRRARTTKPRPMRSRAQLAAAQGHALAHPEQPLLAATAGARDPAGDLDLQALRRPAQGHPRLAAAAVLERVGQALLHEPERGRGRRRAPAAPGSPSTRRSTSRPASRERATSPPRRSSDGCGACSASWPSGRRMPSSRRISVSASRPVASTAPSAPTAASGSRCQRAPRRSRLDDHDRDVVSDDVVQLECDPRALGEDPRVLAPGAVVLELTGLLAETAVEVPARHAAPGPGRAPPRAATAAASTGSPRAGSSARPNAWVRVQRPIPRDGRPAPAGCRRPQG